MIIIFGNQKGGVGKSTQAMAMANFLTIVKGRKVTIIDMDYQQSIASKFDKAKLLENAEPYQVVAAGLEHFPVIREILKNEGEQFMLIDLPGKLDDDGLMPIFSATDIVISPFSYDEFSYDSTVFFSLVMRKINPKVKFVFIPNRIKANAKFEIMQEVNEQLSKFGAITPVIPDRVDFQRITTFYTPPILSPVILPVFEQIYKDYLHG